MATSFTTQGATSGSTTSGVSPSNYSDFTSLLAKPNPNLSLATSTGGNSAYSTLSPQTSAPITPTISTSTPQTSGLLSGTPLNTSAPKTTPYAGTSIVDYLTSTGADSSYAHRAQLAAQYGIQGYTGSADQNTQLLSMLNKPSGLSTPSPTSAPTPTPAQNPNGLTNSQVAQGYSTVQGAYNPVTGQPWAAGQNPNPNPVYTTNNSGNNPPPANSGTPPVDTSGGTTGSTTGGQTDMSRGGITSGLLGYGAGTDPYMGQINQVTGQIADLRKQYGQQIGNLSNGGILNADLTGRGAMLAQQEQALESAPTAQLQALQAARGQGEQAQSSAAGYAQPFSQSYGAQLGTYDAQGNPVLTGASVSSPDVQTIIQKVQNNTMSYNDALSQLNSKYGGQAQALLNQGLGSNFNTNQSNATAGAQTQQFGTQAGYQSALQQGKNLQSQVTDLISKFGLNPADINAVNTGLQKVASNTSDPRYQLLNNYINDIANTYSQILTPPGGSATDTTRGIASSMLDSSMKGQGIITVMQGLDQAAQAKIAGVATAGASNAQTGSTSGTLPSGASYKLVNGVYVKA